MGDLAPSRRRTQGRAEPTLGSGGGRAGGPRPEVAAAGLLGDLHSFDLDRLGSPSERLGTAPRDSEPLRETRNRPEVAAAGLLGELHSFDLDRLEWSLPPLLGSPPSRRCRPAPPGRGALARSRASRLAR